MTTEKERLRFEKDVKEGMAPEIALFPIVAKQFYGHSPREVLEETDGKPAHFYYIAYIFWLWIGTVVGGIGAFIYPTPDQTIRTFLMNNLGAGKDNWLVYAFAIQLGLLLLIILFTICVRPLMYTLRDPGAGWRWR